MVGTRLPERVLYVCQYLALPSECLEMWRATDEALISSLPYTSMHGKPVKLLVIKAIYDSFIIQYSHRRRGTNDDQGQGICDTEILHYNIAGLGTYSNSNYPLLSRNKDPQRGSITFIQDAVNVWG